ncbi:eCIS core domain-containing protein [Streptomyces sp. 4N509B]|uniref:eCIS core domain-containing protein n=1 Tax=Streptomyces sp. 4N509B TaxID=3457413 RepID=UPI003FD0C03F
MHARAREDQHGGPTDRRGARSVVARPGGPASSGPGLAAPDAATPAHLLALQRLVGNQVVARALAERERGGSEPGGSEPAVQRSAVDAVLRTPGRPLAEPVRQEMEARFGGADFSDVRLHTGGSAEHSAREIGARAYTSGSHIVIGSGGEDRHTLAHELTHVIQQRQGPVAGTDNGDGLRISDPSDRFERHAEETARRVLGGEHPPVQRATGEHTPHAPHHHTHADGCGHGLPVQRAPRVRSETLNNDVGDGLMPQAAADQAGVESAFPTVRPNFRQYYEQFPDPVDHVRQVMAGALQAANASAPHDLPPAAWVEAINHRRDEGTDLSQGRYGPFRRNCIEAVRSFIASWSGRPTAARGIAQGVEQGGNRATADWLNAGQFRDPFAYSVVPSDGSVNSAWDAIARVLTTLGHGAASIVVFEPDRDRPVNPNGEDPYHAIAAVNFQGRVLWVDAQLGRVSSRPMYQGTGILVITLRPNLTVFEPAAAPLNLNKNYASPDALPDLL